MPETENMSEVELQHAALEIVENDVEEVVAQAEDEEHGQAQDAEADGDPSEDAVISQDEGVDPEAVIEAPKSWKSEAKDLFMKLPEDVRREVAERDEEQTRTFNRRLNETVQARQKAEAELAQTAQERQRYAQALDQYYRQSQTHDPIFAEARQLDWDRLAVENPAEFVAKRHALEQHASRIQQLSQEHQRVQTQQFQEAVKAEMSKFVSKAPEYSDGKKFEALAKELTPLLQDRYGFTKEEVSSLADHRLLLVARDCLLYHKQMASQRSIAQKREQVSQKVIRPAASRDRRPPADRFKTARARFEKTGSETDRIAAVLAAVGA